jgi:hypothetical protein
MFLPPIERENQNTSERLILIISNKKKEKDNLIIIPLLLEIQNSCQNQIRAMIIYREKTKIRLFCQEKIWIHFHILAASNKQLQNLTLSSVISHTQKYNNNLFIFYRSIQILSEGKRVFCSVCEGRIRHDRSKDPAKTQPHVSLHQPWLRRTTDTTHTQRRCCKLPLLSPHFNPILSSDGSRCRLSIYSHTDLVIYGPKTDSIVLMYKCIAVVSSNYYGSSNGRFLTIIWMCSREN